MPESKITKEKVETFLRKTGFVFEMEVAEYLKNSGWKIDMGSSFLDLEDLKNREIDIIASKTINRIVVYLVIECKQSLENDWVFIRTKENPPLFYYAVKHAPTVELQLLRTNGLFSDIHYFTSRHLICQNYTALRKDGKKVEPLQITEALFKLPKAVIDVASKRDPETRRLFFPIICFSGQIFSAQYKEKLAVKKEECVQFCSSFESESYEEPEKDKSTVIPEHSLYGFGFFNDDLDPKKRKVKSLKRSFKSLDIPQTIDIVSFEFIESFIKNLEKGVSKTPWRKWPLNPRKLVIKPPKRKPL